MSKKFLSLFIFLCTPQINAMGVNRFLARNNTNHRVYLLETTLEPNEEKALAIADDCDLTIDIETPEQVIPITTKIGWKTKLLDITTQGQGNFVATHHQNRRLLILTTFAQGVVITARTADPLCKREITCFNGTIEIPANTERVVIRLASGAEVDPKIINLERDTTGFEIFQNPDGLNVTKLTSGLQRD